MIMVDRIYVEELESRMSSAVALLTALNTTIEAVPEIAVDTVQDGIRGVLTLLLDADQFKPEEEGE
jgi:hypothetical protein